MGSLVFLAGILLVVTVAPVVLERRAFRVSERMLYSTEPLQSAAERVGTAMYELQSRERGFVLTGDRRFLESYAQAGRDLDAALDTAAHTASPEDMEVLARVRAAAAAWRRDVGDPHVQAALAGRASDALAAEARGEGDAAFTAMQGAAAELSGRAQAQLLEQDRHRRRLTRLIDVSVVVLGIAGLVGLGILGVAMSSAQSLRQEAERAHEQNRLKDQFLSLVGHEIRTPVTVIRLVADAIRRHEGEARTDGWLAERLSTLQRQAQRIGWLTDELLDVGRMPTGIELERKSTDAVALTARAVALVKASAPSYPLHYRADAQSAPAELDAPRMEQVLAHLIGNAVKFSLKPRPVRVELHVEGDALEWTIADEGPGIPRQEQSRLFQRFYRGSNAPQSGGIGLGLHLSRVIVMAHGGRIWFESTVGRGTVFHVRVPRRAVPAQRALPRPTVAEQPAPLTH